MKVRISLWVSLAIAASLGLAGCNGSSNNKTQVSAAEQCTAAGGTYANDTCTTQADMQRADLDTKSGAVTTALGGLTGTDDDPTPTTDQIGTVNTAITALETSISNASVLSNEAKRRYQDRVDSAKAEVGRAQAARTKADNDATKAKTVALKKTGDDLYKALVGTTGNDATNPLANITPVTLDSDGLNVTVIPGAGALPDEAVPDPDRVLLKPKSGSVDALSDWKGMDFTGTSAANEDTNPDTPKLSHEARVYHNQGAARTQAFTGTSGKYKTVQSGATDAGYLVAITGDAATDAANLGDSSALGTLGLSRDMIEATAFNHAGTKTHVADRVTGVVSISGTYDGAPGTYRCTGTCRTMGDNKDTPAGFVSGTWNFIPNSGAMVSIPDADYLYFGWWVSKDSDGVPQAASAFSGRVGTESSTDNLDLVVNGATLTGSATYTGSAAGKYAFKDLAGGATHGGHFTADAELKATFGMPSFADDGADKGVTGTIDNFRLNDSTDDPGWEVSLNRGNFAANGDIGGQITRGTPPTPNTTGMTVWSINDNKAPASGSWGGAMYDEAVYEGDDDNSNVPTTIIGQFRSEFTTTQGRMVGAFGVEHSGN